MINFYKENNVPKIQFADGQSVSFFGRVTIAVDNSTGQLIIAEDGHDKFWISTSQTLQVSGANITGTNQQKADLIAPVFNTTAVIPNPTTDASQLTSGTLSDARLNGKLITQAMYDYITAQMQVNNP